MLVVWGRKNSINVQKVMWTVAELGLAHERKDVGGPFGGLDTADYGALNPNRRIPTIVDEDGTTVWESHSCVRYLAARYGAGHLWPEDPSARARADMWLDWMQTTLLPDLAPVFLGLIRAPAKERDMARIERCIRAMGETWRIFDAHMEGRSFVAADTLTMGDIAAGAACYRYHALDIEQRPALPNIALWYERLQEREHFRTHVMIPLS
ncbi:MAG: glutathione S-transferase family protein [Rhodospirillaceae bacterium]|nr:glutathione S-transferase family protein [Rhodospirillaceae bacterium]